MWWSDKASEGEWETVRVWGCDGAIRSVRVSGWDKTSEVVGVWWSDK